MRENLIKSDAEFNRILENMRGVDFSGDKKSSDKRYSYLENMYRDYSTGGDLIESVPGFRRIYSGSRINGLHLQGTPKGERYLVINDDGTLYRCHTDSLASPVKLDGDATVDRDAKSHGFNFKDKLYIGDTHGFKVVKADGSCSRVEENTGSAPYVPTVYLNGKEHEERNLMSATFCEKLNIDVLGNLARETPTLVYRVTDERAGLCAVCGILDEPTSVFIPTVTTIGEREYTVVGIDRGAFLGKAHIYNVYIGDGVTTIGSSAFSGCSQLYGVVCGTSVTDIDAFAFEGTDLEEIFIPGSMKRFGESAIPSTALVKYELNADSYDLIEGAPRSNVLYGQLIDFLSIGVKVHSKATRIDSVTLNGNEVDFELQHDENNLISEIHMYCMSKSDWIGATLSIIGHADTLAVQPDAKGNNFTVRTSEDGIDFTDALKSCTHSAVIDGRAFLWGNPSYPGVLFLFSP